MPVDLLSMGEPMLEFSLQPVGTDGRRLYLEGHGGDTSNAAIAAARAGARVGYITAVGQDPAGDSFLALWQREGVDTSCVFRDPENPTASYFVTQTPKGHEFLYYRANSAASRFGPERVPVAAIAAARIFYASGISQAISAAAADAVFLAIDTARAHGVRVAYDTNYRPRLWPARRAAAVIHAAIAQADIALPSLDDAMLLTGIERPDDLLDFYLRLGPRIVALKMGANGTYLATPERRWRIPPFPCVPVDCTGAGDTFCGSFLARLLAGDAPEQAARYAACAAALMTEGYGGVAPIPGAARVWQALAAVRPQASETQAQ
ncbi:MAG: sugar kinase [Acetobacteraceae bacterium]|nr:sugar kinase [Acetobacteraceae bacterium]